MAKGGTTVFRRGWLNVAGVASVIVLAGVSTVYLRRDVAPIAITLLAVAWFGVARIVILARKPYATLGEYFLTFEEDSGGDEVSVRWDRIVMAKRIEERKLNLLLDDESCVHVPLGPLGWTTRERFVDEVKRRVDRV